MKFVFGGAFQGQEDAAANLFQLKPEEIADGRTCVYDEVYACKAINHFHMYIRRILEEHGELPEGFVSDLMVRNPEMIIISQEIGYGIVPMDAFERLWREQTGRVSCELAQVSDKVIRVVAGIPMCLKGDNG